MREKEMTYDEICARYGINDERLIDLEAGVSLPSRKELYFLVEYFNISRKYLTVKVFEQLMEEVDKKVRVLYRLATDEQFRKFAEMVAKLNEEELVIFRTKMDELLEEK